MNYSPLDPKFGLATVGKEIDSGSLEGSTGSLRHWIAAFAAMTNVPFAVMTARGGLPLPLKE